MGKLFKHVSSSKQVNYNLEKKRYSKDVCCGSDLIKMPSNYRKMAVKIHSLKISEKTSSELVKDSKTAQNSVSLRTLKVLLTNCSLRSINVLEHA